MAALGMEKGIEGIYKNSNFVANLFFLTAIALSFQKELIEVPLTNKKAI